MFLGYHKKLTFAIISRFRPILKKTKEKVLLIVLIAPKNNLFYLGIITLFPPIYGHNTSGIFTLPSS